MNNQIEKMRDHPDRLRDVKNWETWTKRAQFAEAAAQRADDFDEADRLPSDARRAWRQDTAVLICSIVTQEKPGEIKNP